tara:strand:- start:4077 stop:5138 length:1062 start_codon:yes stop_codon:yes gene_type:complete
MNNRTLKRPMFRMGGSANNGITSGLQRKPYAEGSSFEEDFSEQMQVREKLKKQYDIGQEEDRTPFSPGTLSSALANFSLNLAAQPGGDLMGAIGRAGSPALKGFQAARATEKATDRKNSERGFSDVYDATIDLRQAKIEADAEIRSGGNDQFAFQATQETLTSLNEGARSIQKKIGDLKAAPPTSANPDDLAVQIAELEKDLQDNAELQRLITKEKDSDPIATTILKGIANGIFTFEDYQAWKDNGTYPGGLKDGGRAGYQMGGDVMQEQMNITETMTEGMGNPAQAQTQAPNEDFTYDELRSRLPREIKNDIVSLIAVSKQALLDFSNIRTQQDVDNFNQQYNVNLVLPQEG